MGRWGEQKQLQAADDDSRITQAIVTRLNEF